MVTPRKKRYAIPLKHSKAGFPRRGHKKPVGRQAEYGYGPMTVCMAALLRWEYPNKETGQAVVTASDRMITAGDIEYEPQQHKVCFLRQNVVALVAGDMAFIPKRCALFRKH